MGLVLTGSRDHALLALSIQEAHRVASKQQGYVGRTAVQKIMYFLQAMGVAMGYRFDIYHYGPFCEDILADVDWLVADEVVKDTSPDQSRYSRYAPGPAINELLSRHTQTVERHREQVRRVVHALVPLKPEHMELIATLDYLYRQRRASGGPGPWKPAVLARFQEVKKERFTPQQVAETYDALAAVGLFEA
jgi:uncharacterized protein